MDNLKWIAKEKKVMVLMFYIVMLMNVSLIAFGLFSAYMVYPNSLSFSFLGLSGLMALGLFLLIKSHRGNIRVVEGIINDLKSKN